MFSPLTPGFGLNDAHKAWLLRLHTVCKDEPLCLRPRVADPQLFVNLKGGTNEAFGHLLVQTLTNAFGKLKVHKREFEQCGTQHQQREDGNIN
eukprot:5205983-Amphidinium_carterae.1